LAGGAAGSVLSTGLNDLLKQFQRSGQGEVAQSWVGRGPNQSISPQDLGAALGTDHINALAKSRACPAMTCSMGFQGLGQGTADRLQPWLAAVVGCFRGPDVLPRRQRLSLHRS